VNYADHFKTINGPLAVVRVCLICGHTETVRKGRPDAGRGYGFRYGNKARGRMIQHLKTHEEAL